MLYYEKELAIYSLFYLGIEEDSALSFNIQQTKNTSAHPVVDQSSMLRASPAYKKNCGSDVGVFRSDVYYEF